MLRYVTRRGTTLIRACVLFAFTLGMSCAPELGSRAIQPGTADRGAIELGQVSDETSPETVVLVAIDGVRWQDVFHGVDLDLAAAQGFHPSELLGPEQLLPNLHALASAGVALGSNGSDMFATGPNFMSLPGYIEMLTGRASECPNNGCAGAKHSTIVEELGGRSATVDEVALISSWEAIARAAGDSPNAVVSAGRMHGATRGRLALDPIGARLLHEGETGGVEPGKADFRPDRATAAIALHYLRTHRPRFAFVGFGEPDEYAHENDYRGYLSALVHADRVVGEVARVLNQYEREGRRTTLLVTTDHGRARDFIGHGGWAPESAAVWLIASGWGIRRRGEIRSEHRHHLGDVARLVRSLTDPSAPIAIAEVEAFRRRRRVAATTTR